MIEKFYIYVMMFLEDIRHSGFKSTLKNIVFRHKAAVPVYIDCESRDFSKYSLEKTGYSICLLNKNLQDHYSISCRKSRSRKAKYNSKKGYGALVLIKDGKIIGDIWFTAKTNDKLKYNLNHSDLKLLGIELRKGEAYAFDMYVAESERGKDLSTRFMASAMNYLKEMGITRVYGYYLKNNIPALWIHKLIGFKELPEVLLSRFFLFRFSQTKTS